MNRTSISHIFVIMSIGVLLATPTMTVISRNAAFAILMMSFAILLIAVSLGSWREAFRFISDDHVLWMAPSWVVTLAFVVFASSTLLWSPLPSRGFGALAQISVAVIATAICCSILMRQQRADSWLLWALPLAIILGSALAVVELRFDSLIRNFLGAGTENWRLNRAAVTLTLMTPLVLLLKINRYGPALFFVVGLSTCVAVFSSISESAKLAILTSVLVLAISTVIQGRLLFLCCSAAVLVSHLLAPMIGWAVYSWIPLDAFTATGYAEHWVRAQIWWAHAQVIFDAPFFGHGLGASLAAPQLYTGANPAVLAGLDFGHPHNFSIQVWYELGAVGVLLTTVLMVFLFRRILSTFETQLYAAAVIVTGVWTVGFVSHGAWQHWWWALVGIIAILFTVLSKLPRRD